MKLSSPLPVRIQAREETKLSLKNIFSFLHLTRNILLSIFVKALFILPSKSINSKQMKETMIYSSLSFFECLSNQFIMGMTEKGARC